MFKKTKYWVLLGLLVFVLLALMLLPLVIRKVAISKSEDWIGRQIDLKKFRVNYFTSKLTLLGFKLFEKDGSSIFSSFDTLIIDLKPYRLISNELVVEQFYLQGLHTNIVMQDSSFNFDDLLMQAEGDSTTSEDPAQGASYAMKFSNLELKGAFISLRDAAIDEQMELKNFDFFIPYIAINEENKSEAGLKFDFKNGGFFQSKIDINPAQGDFEADILIDSLDISGYNSFVRKYVDIGAFSGVTDIELIINGNVQHPEQARLTGALALNDFELSDHSERKLCAVETCRVTLKDIDPDASRFEIDSILIGGSYLYFEMYDSTNNLAEYAQKILSTNPGTDDSTQVASTPPTEISPSYAVNSLRMEDGRLEIVDKRTGDPFKYLLSELHLEADSISNTSSWVTANAGMLLNERGNLVAEAGFDPSNPMNLEVDYTITDFMLSDLNIYSNHYMGFPILYGDMYYKGHTEISKGQIESDNKLIIRNVELGDKKGGLYDLPLKFALFLLKDKNGVINLDLPVRGDLSDPSLSVGKIVWNTFKNLIIKTAAAPVKLLSGLVNANNTDLEVIEYAFLDTVLSEGRQDQLKLLLDLERQKPELEIELVYFSDTTLEQREIAVALVGQKYDKGGRSRNHNEDKEQFEAYVLKRVNSDTLSLPQACEQLADAKLLSSLRTTFDKKRLNQVKEYLQAMNDSTAIQVHYAKPQSPKNIGLPPRFEIKYGLKEQDLE
jgi:hypothetical protein